MTVTGLALQGRMHVVGYITDQHIRHSYIVLAVAWCGKASDTKPQIRPSGPGRGFTVKTGQTAYRVGVGSPPGLQARSRGGVPNARKEWLCHNYTYRHNERLCAAVYVGSQEARPLSGGTALAPSPTGWQRRGDATGPRPAGFQRCGRGRRRYRDHHLSRCGMVLELAPATRRSAGEGDEPDDANDVEG